MSKERDSKSESRSCSFSQKLRLRRFRRRFTVQLNTLPISGWHGAMVLVPPFATDDEPIDD
jgi:hypothetical protein